MRHLAPRSPSRPSASTAAPLRTGRFSSVRWRELFGHTATCPLPRKTARTPAWCESGSSAGSRQAGNLVRVLAEGGDSPAVREELRTIEAGLRGLRIELAGLDPSAPVATAQVHPVLVKARLERLHTLFQQDVARARVELRKHLDGPLTITPGLSLAGERRVEIKGRLKPHSLWKGPQERRLRHRWRTQGSSGRSRTARRPQPVSGQRGLACRPARQTPGEEHHHAVLDKKVRHRRAARISRGRHLLLCRAMYVRSIEPARSCWFQRR